MSCALQYAVVLSSPNVNIKLTDKACCITCTIPLPSEVLGCYALLFIKSQQNILMGGIEKQRRMPLCLNVTGRGEYSVAVFEWKEDGSIGVYPVAVTNSNGEIIVTTEHGFTEESSKSQMYSVM